MIWRIFLATFSNHLKTISVHLMPLWVDRGFFDVSHPVATSCCRIFPAAMATMLDTKRTRKKTYGRKGKARSSTQRGTGRRVDILWGTFAMGMTLRRNFLMLQWVNSASSWVHASWWTPAAYLRIVTKCPPDDITRWAPTNYKCSYNS